jgi:hypothetical protein
MTFHDVKRATATFLPSCFGNDCTRQGIGIQCNAETLGK